MTIENIFFLILGFVLCAIVLAIVAVAKSLYGVFKADVNRFDHEIKPDARSRRGME
jgi:mannose/fructose/N-acetylgalactosamine-specific phosphotransferase system component IIC